MYKKSRVLVDIVLVLAILAGAGILFLINNADTSPGIWVVVSVEGEETARYPLDRDGIYSLNGGTNTLVIQDGYAFLSDADCPDKLCVNMGKINRSTQLIVCLPNKLVVTVESDAEGDIDV